MQVPARSLRRVLVVHVGYLRRVVHTLCLAGSAPIDGAVGNLGAELAVLELLVNVVSFLANLIIIR